MTTLRLTLISIILCMFFYANGVLGFARTFVPEKATGSLVTNEAGQVIGSRLIAQPFTSDRYFHPRPSACDYNGQGAAGSNLSPTNPELTTRAQAIIGATGATGATSERPIPADLVTASGSGLDPHITVEAARFQIPRIAAARNLTADAIDGLLPHAPIVNVLELNLALDALKR